MGPIVAFPLQLLNLASRGGQESPLKPQGLVRLESKPESRGGVGKLALLRKSKLIGGLL